MEQLKWGIDKSTLKVGDYNPPSLAIDETSRQRKSVGGGWHSNFEGNFWGIFEN